MITVTVKGGGGIMNDSEGKREIMILNSNTEGGRK